MTVQFRLWKIPSDEELEFLNAHNEPLRFERTLDGQLSLSPPTGFATGERNSELNRQLANWNIAHGHGSVIDSSTGISIGLNGAPDGGWLSGERRRGIPAEERGKFLKIAPEIVFELRSPSDRAPAIAKRAGDWVAAGVKLAVVLDPVARTAIAYGESGPGPAVTSGTLRIDKALLPGATGDLVLDLFAIFDAGA
jgi:Uma2 family endonuclease